MNPFKSRIWVSYLVYIIPLTYTWYLIKGLFYLLGFKERIDDIFAVYLIFVGFVVLSLIVGAIYVTLQIQKPFILKLILTLVFGILFVPIFLLFLIGGLVIKLFPRFSCPVTYFVDILTQFMTGMIIIKMGKLKSVKKGKAVMVLNHRSSGDYSFASTVAGSNNWRVMVGANLWKHWWLRWFLNRVGLKIPRSKEEADGRAAAVREANNFVSSHKNAKVIFFSEGTRNRDDDIPLLPFYDGAFKLAIQHGIPIIPVVIIGMQYWRRPGPQDTKTYVKGKKKFKLWLIPVKILKFFAYVFTEGINPSIVRAYYLDPVPSEGKTAEQLNKEVWQIMYDAYIKYAKIKLEEITEPGSQF